VETQERVRHLAYRCQSCNRLITKLELLDAWTRSERDGVNHSICPCGSGRISPTNPTLLEELFLPRVWKLWWKEVVQKRSA
jgi:hypothetical protein